MTKKQFLITEDGSHTIYIPAIDETYHSVHGAIQESNYVFIEQGLRHLIAKEKVGEIKIFEVGFGTGLNALLSATNAKNLDITIKYESLELYPLNEKEILQLNYAELLSHPLAKSLFSNIHGASWGEWTKISESMIIQKLKVSIQDYQVEDKFDLCYFDAFAPNKQPEMWTIEILRKIYSLLNKHGVFATYCAKGQLKRDLKQVGFEVETLPGPPMKLQMVRATKI